MNENELTDIDSAFLKYLRGICIFIIVFGHVGGFWIFRPYSEFLHASVPVFFFLSGSVSFYSFRRSQSLYFYYSKRILSLLIPYYLLCLLSFFVYITTNFKLPSYDFNNLLSWLTISASNSIMPFPIGQVWFLKVLIIVIILSPLYFLIYKSTNYLVVVFLAIIFLSFIQLLADISPIFNLKFINLYTPLIYSSFFIFGFAFFASPKLKDNNKFLYLMALVSFSLVALLVSFLHLNIDFAYHNFPPDIYFVLGSFFLLFIILIFRTRLTSLIKRIRFAELFFSFFHKHTFSIFLLHTFSIYLSEKVLGLVEPPQKTITYGVVKLVAVLIITCSLSPPFTKISNQLSLYCIEYLDRFSPTKRFKVDAQNAGRR